WLRIAVISAHVEVLRRKQGAYSGIKAVCILICIGRDAPFGAKPPQAGSHKSLMFPAKGKELFYHKECKFAIVGVDQTSRRSLLIPLRGCYAPLDFLRSAKPHYENFDAPHTRLAQDDSAACSFAAQNFGGLLVNHSSRMPESVPSLKTTVKNLPFLPSFS
ncbi:MAG: hypothetical protein IJW34_00460, partial [Clostridia bacterium]|nr:hypothetical protein [Clostridia bacterium]